MTAKAKAKKATIVRIALIQLYSAIEHYYDKNYVCAITLAGAAEEILGSIAKKKKGYNEFDGAKEYIISLFEFFKAPTPSEGKVKKIQNQTRNGLKHNDGGINKRIGYNDFQFISEQHIMAALKNYMIIHKHPPRPKLFHRFLEDML